ncbi:Transcription factor lepE-like protein [Cladobotryum mycophilum]|uniref:Transcription factor lepE-like protein n=1 Tax=Cladobotryum mycophilum TaxID=491253 RepID=A0ABR0SPQ5_9HYPO
MSVFTLNSKTQEHASMERPETNASSNQSSYSISVTRPVEPPTPVSQHESLSVQRAGTLQISPDKAKEPIHTSASKPTKPSVGASSADIEVTSSQLCGTLHFHRENESSGQSGPKITRSVVHKARLFGQSHWINTVEMFARIFEMSDNCKVPSSTPWPVSPTRELPSRDIADKLVDCYLQTNESVYRVLHLPKFRREYEDAWTLGCQPDIAFLVQLKLVLAIGAASYDDEISLRPSAIRWIYEAQTWVSELEFKSRLGTQYIQTNILLLQAREVLGIGSDSIWASAGDLLRRAMSMGLHRDPSYMLKMTTFAAEMHRSDFDTKPPGNFNDDQLMDENPVPKPEDQFTQMSISIALRQTFPSRLAATKFLNDLGSNGTYEETLRFDAELRSSYKTLCRTLQGFKSTSGLSVPSKLELRIVDFIMHRYISAIHGPFFGPSLHEAAYAFSRKMSLESAVRLWCAGYPGSSIMTSTSEATSYDTRGDLLARLVCCGHSFYRIGAMQASLTIAADIIAEAQEEQGLSPAPMRADLWAVLKESKAWCLHSIKVGETNIKGYMLECAIFAYINALRLGVGEEEIPALLMKAAEEAVERCLPILTKMADEGREHHDESDQDVGLDMSFDLMEDWDLLAKGSDRHDERRRYEENDHQPHQASLVHELLGGAAAYEAAKAYEDHVAKNGHPPSHAKAKEILAGFAGAFIDREVETKGLDWVDREKAKRHAEEHVYREVDNDRDQGRTPW